MVFGTLLAPAKEQSEGCDIIPTPGGPSVRWGKAEDVMTAGSFAGGVTPGKLPFYRHMYVQVLVAIAAGILLGHFCPQLGASMQPLGDAFIKLVRMVIAPVIFLTVNKPEPSPSTGMPVRKANSTSEFRKW